VEVLVKKTNKAVAERVSVSNRKHPYEPVRGYSLRYQQPDFDSERARKEAEAAAELADQYLIKPPASRAQVREHHQHQNKQRSKLDHQQGVEFEGIVFHGLAATATCAPEELPPHQTRRSAGAGDNDQARQVPIEGE